VEQIPLIGVISKAGQVSAVEEFFELFKTPWEFYAPGKAYDAVIATVDKLPAIQARLLLVYGAEAQTADTRFGIMAGGRQAGGILNDRDGLLPIYTGLLTFEPCRDTAACQTVSGASVGIRTSTADGIVIRLGYDLFDEVAFLLSSGQTVEHAPVPALDIHIAMLRRWILEAGMPLLEIPPAPAGHSFIVCLTHDIDFIGIRRHFCDHSMWGFVFRATAGALWNFKRGRLSLSRLLRSWLAVASLPFVYVGLVRDFWEPFEWYLKVEDGLSPTYFLIPFKRRPGARVPGRHTSRRASAYGAADLHAQTRILQSHGCEVGVHGIDSWHDAVKGTEEKAEVASVAGECSGIRMHWLLRDENTPAALESAGYSYDSTVGYNETVGYRAGTSQVFRPAGAQTLLELPLHIQDGALFYPQRLDLTEPEAERRCRALIATAGKFGGVLTVLWHDRSHGPERFWGGFYVNLLAALKSLDVWFGTAGQVVGWFRKRRMVRFERAEEGAETPVRIRYEGGDIQPPLRVRLHRPARPQADFGPAQRVAPEFVDLVWTGNSIDELEKQIASQPPSAVSDIACCSYP
jgi:hypothetical protein